MGTETAAALAILAIFGAYLILILLIGLVMYILGSIGLKRISDREGRNYGYLAWIPFARDYKMGEIAFENNYMKWVLLAISVITSGIFAGLMGAEDGSMMFNILGFVFWIIAIIAQYNIFKKYSKNYIVMTVFTVITLGMLGPIFIFAIRNNEMINGNSQTTKDTSSQVIKENIIEEKRQEPKKEEEIKEEVIVEEPTEKVVEEADIKEEKEEENK